MESEKQITEALRLLGQGEKEKAMTLAEQVEASSQTLSVEDMQDIASIYFASRQFDKALKTLEG